MPKIVYNACFGGFSISPECVKLARELSGDPRWGGAIMTGDTYPNGTEIDNDYGSCYYYGSRHNKWLVQAVETLGSDAASGACAKLEIHDCGDEHHGYDIEDYDGMETVRVDDRSWHTSSEDDWSKSRWG